MVAMNSRGSMTTKNNLRKSYHDLLPGVDFVAGKTFYWSPKDRRVHYDQAALETETGQWALLHEIAHAALDHADYHSDFQLLALEVAAWEEAKKLAATQDIRIDEEHIEDCLDTYRDWLYARSTCPTCRLNSLQINETTYNCPNCNTSWTVSLSRFCRPYRLRSSANKKIAPEDKD